MCLLVYHFIIETQKVCWSVAILSSCVLVTRSSDLAMSIVVGTAKEKLLIFIKELSQLSFRVL